VWLLTEDCPEAGDLGRRARQRLADWASPLQPSPVDVTAFPAQLAADAPVDATPWLVQARQPQPPGPEVETAALLAVVPDFSRRMTDFRARVRMQAPFTLLPEAVADFVCAWDHFWGSNRHPADFPLSCFDHELVNALTEWPAHPSYFSWATRPTWIDRSEWDCLRCCYNATVVSRVDRAALFLLIFGALNVPQIVRLFRLLGHQTGWNFPLNAAGYAAATEHLVQKLAAVLRGMVETRRERVAAG
jgi:hypothetical protein